MLNAFWNQITLTPFDLSSWRQVSLVHQLLAPLRQWRQGSWLLPWGDWIGLGLLMALFGLAPYVSTALIGILMMAAGALWVLLTLTDEAGEGLTPIHLMVILFWGVMALATAISPVKAAALQGLVKLTLNLLVFLLMARVLRRSQARNWLVLALLLTSLPVAGYGLRQYFFGAAALATWVDPLSASATATRVYSYLGNPNLLGGYLIPAVGLSAMAVFAWPRWLPKLLALLLVGVNTICLVLTLSRGAWIGFLVGGFILLALVVHFWSIRFTPFWRRWAMPMLLGSAAAVTVLGVLAVDPLRARVLSMFAGRQDSSNNFRINVWAAVIEMIKDRPILGIGPGNDAFNAVYPLYQRPRYTALSAYSIFLETAVEAGLVGLAVLIWLLVVTFSQGWVQLQRLRLSQDNQAYWLMGAIASQAGMLCHGLVDTIWYRPQVSTLWWLMMAIVASYYVTAAAPADE
ncbi:MAG: putative bicarbonate transporter, IctB family [Cyanobacteria bacterium Co-bin8]|nr:putative bicarbonate transporter, IctB family [Cyanobacteria bacterium Co-bin8]